jgi:hypothetical protein
MSDAFDPKPGNYQGKAVKGSEQYGESPNGNPELLLQVIIPELATPEFPDGRVFTTVLYFSAEAAPYSIPRLRSLGWEGNDLSDLKGIDKNEVMINIAWPVDPGDGKAKLKVQIGSGAGTFSTKKPVDPKAFAARVGAIAGLPTAPAAASAPKPKF